MTRGVSNAFGGRIYKGTGLNPVDQSNVAETGDQHKQQNIDAEAPDHPVCQRIKPAQSEQGGRVEQAVSAADLGQPFNRNQAGGIERRQHQGVDPEQKACAESRQNTVAVAAAPVDAANDGGQELDCGYKRKQAEGCQRAPFTQNTVVEIAHQQQADDGDAPDPQQQGIQVVRL